MVVVSSDGNRLRAGKDKHIGQSDNKLKSGGVKNISSSRIRLCRLAQAEEYHKDGVLTEMEGFPHHLHIKVKIFISDNNNV